MGPTAPIPQSQTAPVTQENGGAPAAVANPALAASGELQGGQAGRLIRGGELLGRPVWGANRERLGIVRDFVIDQQNGCPAIFFALAPDISGLSGEYVIVPFDALQVSFDERQGTNLLTLGVTRDNLQRAPRLAVDRWSSLRDRQFITGAKQFYQRIERTAARPQIDGVPEGPTPAKGS